MGMRGVEGASAPRLCWRERSGCRGGAAWVFGCSAAPRAVVFPVCAITVPMAACPCPCL